MSTLSELDALYDQKKFEEVYNALEIKIKESDRKNADELWRYARCCREMSSLKGAHDKAAHDKFIELGFQAAKEAYELQSDDSDTNKWYAIFLDLHGRLTGINDRIKNSFKVLEHLEIARKTQPKDFATLHALGVWHFEVSNVSFVQRTLAKTFFSSPPTSTYAKALPFLLEAEELKPGDFASNALYLARTYRAMSDKANAKKYCQVILDNKTEDLDTIEAKKEATDMMKRL